MPRYFRARHAFERDPNEDGEMSVAAGELLMHLDDRSEAEGDGWTLVQSLATGESGFVPTEWLLLLSAEEEQQLTVGTTGLRAVATLPTSLASGTEHSSSSGGHPTAAEPALSSSGGQAPAQSSTLQASSVAQAPAPPSSSSTATASPAMATAATSPAVPSSSFLYTNPRFTTIAEALPPPPPPPAPPALTAPFPPRPQPPQAFDPFPAPTKDADACCASTAPLAVALQRLVGVTAASTLERPPALRAAVAAEDYDEVYRRSDGFFRDLRAHYHESSATLTATSDAMASRIAHGAGNLDRFHHKLSALKDLLDEERRKWRQQHEVDAIKSSSSSASHRSPTPPRTWLPSSLAHPLAHRQQPTSAGQPLRR